MKKKRVLMVHNFYQIGGGEHTVFENEKNLLIEKGHEVYVYTRSNDELKRSKWKMLLMPFSTIWSAKTYRDVRKLIREKQIDIVHCHNTFPLISPSVYHAARSLKVPVVQTIHNFRFLCPNGLFYCDGRICEQCREQESFLPALKKGCYRNSRVQTAVVVAMLKIHRWLGTYGKINYIFLTEFNRSRFEGLVDGNGDNVFIKPNFVCRKNEEQMEAADIPQFVYAGRLDRNKGVDFILKAWPTLPSDYQLYIYGDGELREECEAAAAAYSQIHYLGFCPQEKIFAHLRESAALLFPSTWYEGYPMIITESFSVGRPVVSANIGNHATVVRTSGGGVLYEAGREDSFAAAIEEILKNNAAYSEKAESYYQQYLTKEKNYEMLCDIYDKARKI